MKTYYLYVLASHRRGTLYIGVTNNLLRRVREHKEGKVPGFTQQYRVKKLVYFEESSDIRDVIAAEKRIKKWNRDWKINLIERTNPQWLDLSPGLLGGHG